MTFPKVTYSPIGSPAHGVFSRPAYQGGNVVQAVTSATILGASLYSWWVPEAEYITDNSGVEYWRAKNHPSDADFQLDKEAVDGKRPTYTASNADMNGLPSVDFLIANLEQMDCSPNFGDCDTDKSSIFMVIKVGSLATGSFVQWTQGANNTFGITVQPVGGTKIRFRIDDGSITYNEYTVEAGVLDNTVVLGLTYDGNAGHAKLWINGVQKGATLSCGTLNKTLDRIFIMGTPGQTAGFTSSGDIGEIIVTKTDIEADGTLATLNTHLMEKFAIGA